MGEKDSEGSESAAFKNVSENSDGGDELMGLEENSMVSSFDSSFDVSGKSLDFPLLEGVEGGVEGLYMYKNVFNLIPKAIGALGKVKILKFFGNEVNLFPTGELKNLVELESLQVKLSLPGLSGLDLQKLKNLKQLELCKVPSRASAFPLLRDITDLSFNKLRNLPVEITHLNSLLSLKVVNNKLIELPPGLSSLQRLESLDFSNNRITSLENLDLLSMYNLQRLNLQHNKLLRCCSIPSWICCNLEGSFIDLSKDDFTGSSSKMDVVEGCDQETSENSQIGASITLSGHLCGSSPNHPCFGPRKSKRWKRQIYVKQRARQERLNNKKKCVVCKHSQLIDESLVEGSSSMVDDDINDSEQFTEEAVCEDSLASVVDEHIRLKEDHYVEISSCVAPESIETCIDDCKTCDASVVSLSDAADMVEESSSSEVSNSPPKSKRHLDGVIDNPKPCKNRRPVDHSELSCKYSMMSFCGIDDYLPDGFYDAGRGRPFMSISSYEQNLHLDSREVILLDRQRDEMLDVIALRAQALICHFKQIDDTTSPSILGDIPFLDLCEKALRSIKSRQNSVVVPLGSLQLGVCRHRALLMKYLCDRIEPRISCELVRGYLDFSPHAWNVIVVKRGESWVRMIIDACRPLDIKEETDPEYFCRYVPLNRINVSVVPDGIPGQVISFSSLCGSDKIHKALVQCKLGSLETMAKVRALESAIMMENIKGGSLKKYVDKLSNAGEKHLPVELSVFIARDIANVDKKRADCTPTVKLCDFDMAIPLRSHLHTCCIAHTGIPPPDLCVGTPRWMAPEVVQAMSKRSIYGLGADIWSFGCVFLELLTLQSPFSESISELDIHNSLLAGKRPQLPEELEAMAASKAELDDLAKSCSGSDLDKKQSESRILRFLVSIYRWCTETDPDDRPTAENLYNLLLTCANSLPSQSQEDS
ncbi:hypothetical protein HAX54_000058 [Datura stramonium]|uniref:Protein kinase domain-containing protein n=1 Tax=Datura stramonium TaxID=4076 RepID=A0ABS8RIE6_DATST|nr:hypothetical protein [Datura stramonium]